MIASPVIWGLLLGLGSSLHCSGMCGPLGCSLLLMGGQERSASALLGRLAAMQLGRIVSYVVLGALFGIFGAGLQASFNTAALHLAMQWAAGAAVVWLGLATAGMVPSLAVMDRLGAPLARGVADLRAKLSGGGAELGLVAGLLWGITPCAMVYAALFNSLLAGSPGGGLLLMLAFGLGTMPAVMLSTLALVKARSMAGRPGREVAGALMIAAGCAALLLTVPGSPLCITA